MNDENLLKAFDAWEEMSQTQETRIAYISRLKSLLDRDAAIADTLAKGKKEGKEEGLTEGIEIGKEEGIKEGIKEGIVSVAIKMIAKGKSNEEIMDATDLTLEEVETLRTFK